MIVAWKYCQNSTEGAKKTLEYDTDLKPGSQE
jgi:hypothetical protein